MMDFFSLTLSTFSFVCRYNMPYLYYSTVPVVSSWFVIINAVCYNYHGTAELLLTVTCNYHNYD